MVNQVMQQKRLKLTKQKRMRRAYLKPYFGQIKVPQTVDKSKVPLDAEGIFDYRKRGKGFYDPYLEAIFPGVRRESGWKSAPINARHVHVKSTGEPYPIEGEDNRLNGRKYCLTRAEEERVISMLASPAEHFVTVRQGGITKTRTTMHYNSDYSHVYFTLSCSSPAYIMKSMVFEGSGAKDRAMFALQYNRIEWLERIDLATDKPDPQSG